MHGNPERQPLYLPQPAKWDGRGGANWRTNAQFGARNCSTSQSEYASSEARRRPVCQIGAHNPGTPLTSRCPVSLWLVKSSENFILLYKRPFTFSANHHHLTMD